MEKTNPEIEISRKDKRRRKATRELEDEKIKSMSL